MDGGLVGWMGRWVQHNGRAVIVPAPANRRWASLSSLSYPPPALPEKKSCQLTGRGASTLYVGDSKAYVYV